MTETTRRRTIEFALFAMWLVVVVYAAWNHVVWRDEVRAYSRALHGDNLFAMLQGIHGEGHPALWYLLVRGAHTLLPRPQVLQLVAFLVASAAVLILLLRSPFSWPLKALLLAGNAFVFEYSVMARNYGVSALLLFLLAMFYPRHRNRGPLLGILLFLLANSNVHSLLLVGGFLLFWLVDIAIDDRALRRQRLRTFSWNAAIAVLGGAVCILTIFPPVSDSAVIERPSNVFPPLLEAVFLPGGTFKELMTVSLEPHLRAADPDSLPFQLLLSALLFGSTLGLIRRPAIFLAALVTLAGMSVLFKFVYPGSYRHEALWLSFLIGCYWIATVKPSPADPPIPSGLRRLLLPVSTLGWTLFVVLVAIQVPIGCANVAGALRDGPPLSRSRDLGVLIRRRPDLRDAVLIAEPDYLLESLPYYMSNPTYLMREQRFGNVVTWTRKARLQLSLGDVLANARSLRSETNRPVLILMAHPLDPGERARVFREGYAWTFVAAPREARDFLAATQLIERFPKALVDESFDVYLLK